MSREAMKQEPVGWLDAEMSQAYTVDELADASGTGFLPLYTAPPKREWVGLTEEEVKAIANKRNDYGLPMTGRMWVFVADLTDKLKEKNHG